MKWTHLIGLANVLILSACDLENKTVLNETAQIEPWVQQVTAQAKLEAEQINAQEHVALLNVALPAQFAQVFTAPLGASLEQLVEQAPPQVQTPEEALLLVAQPTVRVVHNLAQAVATELKYAGFMTQNNQSWGLVKVGERLYPVHVGDLIGQGRWRVLALNAQTMQLHIANKVVTYDKN